ncbi:hypothetical protein GQ457_16G016410 [Hibiscus cannabinus]
MDRQPQDRMAWAPRIGPNRVWAWIRIRVVNRITQFDSNQKALKNLAAQHLRRRYSIANSCNFPTIFEMLASSSSDLLRPPSDRNENEICRPPIPSLPFDRWDPWAEPPFAGECSVRNGLIRFCFDFAVDCRLLEGSRGTDNGY